MDLEALYDAWERYKDLLRRCPHHGLPLWLQVQMFYNGVNPSTRQMIDTAAGGTINNKTPEEAYKFIEEMSLNNYQWQVMRTNPTKIVGIYNVDSITMLPNPVELLNKKIDGLLGSTQVRPVMRCDSSRRGVHTEYQPFNPTTEEEQVHYMGNNNFRSQNNPYSNTYNASWRNHPNFSWDGQGNQRPQNPLGFQQPPYQQEKKLNLEEMLSKFISVSKSRFQNTETALEINNLPSNTEPNPREQLNAINVQGEEGSVEPEPESREETMVSKGKCEIGHNENKMMPDVMKFLKELLANKLKLDEASHVKLNAALLEIARTIIDVGTGELTLHVGDETITLQARNFGNTSKIEGDCINHSTKTDNMVQPTLQEMSLKEVHEPCSSNNRGPIHEERRLQIEELDEWQTHKPRTYDKPKLRQNELNTSPNQLKVGDKV
ncbi:hypothetical protein CXB51_003340 [Gossypium anomalum]|uniref:Retrotransposon gag domain-containing protein n=1 Tax=Gossypium anomalum TaxID=47600 RepID=A0A8J6D7C1_9ROSI|nr:hypothetical protein CXB51_003340 [Gossypium anomalum]